MDLKKQEPRLRGSREKDKNNENFNSYLLPPLNILTTEYSKAHGDFILHD
jgi:hypothetical protein